MAIWALENPKVLEIKSIPCCAPESIWIFSVLQVIFKLIKEFLIDSRNSELPKGPSLINASSWSLSKI